MIENKCSCGGELYVESPNFADMTQKDVNDWKNAGGRTMILCKECGKESKTTKHILGELQKKVEKMKIDHRHGDRKLVAYRMPDTNCYKCKVNLALHEVFKLIDGMMKDG